MSTRLPEILERQRAAKGMTQEEVALAIGKGLRAYQYYEKGETSPRAGTLVKLADVLDFDLKEIYEYAGLLHDTPQDYTVKRRDHKLNGLKEGIPIYEDAPYTLGNIESYRDSPQDKADFWVTIPGLRNCNYGVRATGDSMHPLIRNHALVVGEEITDTSFIPSGDVYIIRAKNGIETIKYVQTHDTDPKKFVLVPYNTAAKPTDILKKDILKIWRAKAVFNVL
jgi:transcriptional regulator with XRE-family HTH domain